MSVKRTWSITVGRHASRNNSGLVTWHQQKEMDAGAKLAFSFHEVQDTGRWNDSTHLNYLKCLTDLARESSPR